MRIDLSELSPEKKRKLEANPELLKQLEQEIPKQIQSFNRRKAKMDKGRAKWQRDLENVGHKVEDAKQQAEELRRQYDPVLMKINRRFIETAIKGSDILVCPECGEGDKGNRMNGKSWCIKCNLPLVSKAKTDKWLGKSRIDISKKPLKEELKHVTMKDPEEVDEERRK